MVRKQRQYRTSNELALAYFWAIMTEGRRINSRPISSAVFVGKKLLCTADREEPRLKQRLQEGDKVATLYSNEVCVVTRLHNESVYVLRGGTRSTLRLRNTYKCVDNVVLPKLPMELRETTTARLLHSLVAWVTIGSGQPISPRLQGIANKLVGSSAYLKEGFSGINLDDPGDRHTVRAILPDSDSLEVVSGGQHYSLPRRQFVPYTRHYLCKAGLRDIDWRGEDRTGY